MTIIDARKGLLLAAIACSLLGFFGSNVAGSLVRQDRSVHSCSIPEPGSCMAISECQHVVNIIKTKGVHSRDAQQYLSDRSCGFDGYNPKVCCPNSGNGNSGESGNDNPTWTDDPDEPFENPLSLLPVTCGQQSTSRIIGGENTELDEFPWMAVIEYDSNRGVQTGCGGVLISKRYVLTAAHCIRAIPSNWRLGRVRLGEYNLRTDPDCQSDGAGGQICADPVTIVPVEAQIVHEEYMRPHKLVNDIALLRLARDVAFGDYIQPICLPPNGAAERKYWSAGWGQTERAASSDVKLKVNLPYFDFAECGRVYATRNIVLGDGQMCAGGVTGKDTCKGDSGGPLMRQIQQLGGINRWVVDGVVSFGFWPCGQPGWPAVYTKVYKYIPWILSKLRP